MDHDLGGEDTIWPVIEVLERAAFVGEPIDIGVVHVHSANPIGAARIAQALRLWGYDVRSAAGAPHVGYLDVRSPRRLSPLLDPGRVARREWVATEPKPPKLLERFDDHEPRDQQPCASELETIVATWL